MMKIKEDSIIFLASNMSPSMFDKTCKMSGNVECGTLSISELKELSKNVDIKSFYSENDRAIVNRLEDLDIDHTSIREKIELDPDRGDILIVIRARNFNILKEDEIPEHVVLDIYYYRTMTKGEK